MLQLAWVMSEANTWLRLKDANLSSVKTEGVYVIWMPGSDVDGAPIYIRVGQGDVADRIACHRLDEDVQEYENGNLRFTFARVDRAQRGGVERYLAEKLQPLVGDRFPTDPMIAVNLPQAA